jgi:hypothetical protein
MFLLLLILICSLSFKPIYAQTPLYYQLIEAYRSSSDETFNPPIMALPTPIITVTPSPPPLTSGKTVTIAVLGDSMIDTLQPGLPQMINALRQYYPGRKFRLLNYGVGGRDIEYGLYRLTHNYDYLGNQIPSLISQNPDIVVVESFAYNNFGISDSGINRHWLGLGAVTTTLKEKLPHAKIVIAATIAPNSATFGNGIKDVHFSISDKIEKTSTIKLYLQNTVDFATSQGYPLADAYHLSLFTNQGLQEFINAGDNLHPSGPGGQFFCDTVVDTIYRNKLIE